MFTFQQYTKQLLQSLYCCNNYIHITFLKNRACVKYVKSDNEEMHTLPQNLTVPCAYCDVLSSVSWSTIMAFYQFLKTLTENAIVLKNSWRNTYVVCCPSCEKANLYLPQVPHKATRKRVFETRFLYIKGKQTNKEKKNHHHLSKRHLNTGTVITFYSNSDLAITCWKCHILE